MAVVSRHGSLRWIAEQLNARGIPASHDLLRRHPERVVWEDGEPVGLGAIGYRCMDREAVIARMLRAGELTTAEAERLREAGE